jgi:hypothetical protein
MSTTPRRHTAVSLGLALLALTLVAAPAWAIGAKTFQPKDASYDAGWYWLRDSYAFAGWTFGPPDSVVADGTQCQLRFSALVTQTTHGGAGHGKHAQLTLSSGGLTHTFPVHLENAESPTMTSKNRKGYGAEAVLDAASLPEEEQTFLRQLCQAYQETGSLHVAYVWQPSQEDCCKGDGRYPHHVAVNKKSVEVLYPR